eukprot:GHVN01098795.1.p1 GENE.GHVN01098795.1~~GHVN01098795.1.p1  ORF type:complete len:186 (+),score=13.41 GHVN01098795.1:203-760(+)
MQIWQPPCIITARVTPTRAIIMFLENWSYTSLALTVVCVFIVSRFVLSLFWTSEASGGGDLGAQTAPLLKHFTLEELAAYNGTKGARIYVSIRGVVYDVSLQGREFYGPGGSYHLFAGRDATMALATMSLEPSVLDSKDWQANELPLLEKETLASWIEKFESKYAVVGYVDGYYVPSKATNQNSI